MEGVPNRIVRRLGLAACVLAMYSGAAFSDCHIPAAAGHSHGPGESAWVGHTGPELQAALGQPSFRLGKPYHVAGGPDYRIDAYTTPQPARAGCVDAYKLDTCGVITAYYCR